MIHSRPKKSRGCMKHRKKKIRPMMKPTVFTKDSAVMPLMYVKGDTAFPHLLSYIMKKSSWHFTICRKEEESIASKVCIFPTLDRLICVCVWFTLYRELINGGSYIFIKKERTKKKTWLNDPPPPPKKKEKEIKRGNFLPDRNRCFVSRQKTWLLW